MPRHDRPTGPPRVRFRRFLPALGAVFLLAGCQVGPSFHARPGFTRRAQMLKADDVAAAVLFVATRRDGVAIPELRIVPEPWAPRP